MALIFPPNTYARGGFNFRTYKMGVAPILNGGLNFNFLSGSLDGSLTFARASSAGYVNASGVLTQASSNVARFDTNPSTLALRGILIEPQRENRVTYSVPQSAQWTTSLVTVDWAAYSSPDGGTNASAATDTAGSGTHSIRPTASIAYTLNSTYVISVFVKAGTATVVQITFPYTSFGANQYVNFNLSEGTYSATGGTAGMQDAGNGFYRCWFSATCSTASTVSPPVVFFVNNNYGAGRSPTYTGTGKVLYIWGHQTEIGSTPTAYIPTSGSAATRLADALSFTVPSGISTLRYVFDDNSTQDVSVSAGTYTVPTNLNRAIIKRIYSV